MKKMKNGFKINITKWFVVGGFLLLMSITSVPNAQAAGLTDDEVSWLTYMREEEKLARDVYVFLNEMWDSSIFSNIAVSEQRHMDAIKTLLDRYGIPDPAAGKAIGEFLNEDLQKLYLNLITRGEGSLIDALCVGVIIEVTDIEDLEKAIKLITRRDIKTVYSNLLEGSENHLAAFENNLANLE